MLMSFEEVYAELSKRNRPRASVMSAPPTSGIGTIRSHAGGPEFEDDGFSSDEEGDDLGDETDDEGHSTPIRRSSLGRPALSLPLQGHKQEPIGSEIPTPIAGTADGRTPVPTPMTARPPFTQSPSPSPTTAEPPALPASASPSSTTALGKGRSTSGFMPKILRRPTLPISLPSSSRRASSSEIVTPTDETAVPTGVANAAAADKPVRPDGKRKKSFKKRDGTGGGFNLSGEHDIVGIVMIEIKGASDLPRLKNSMSF
jgi:phosphatidylserine decarboxylase